MFQHNKAGRVGRTLPHGEDAAEALFDQLRRFKHRHAQARTLTEFLGRLAEGGRRNAVGRAVGEVAGETGGAGHRLAGRHPDVQRGFIGAGVERHAFHRKSLLAA